MPRKFGRFEKIFNEMSTVSERENGRNSRATEADMQEAQKV